MSAIIMQIKNYALNRKYGWGNKPMQKLDGHTGFRNEGSLAASRQNEC